MSRKLLDIDWSRLNFYNWYQSKGNKGKNKQSGLHQTKQLCATNEEINKVKRQRTEWEIIFANHKSDKKLVSKIYKDFRKLSEK